MMDYEEAAKFKKLETEVDKLTAERDELLYKIGKLTKTLAMTKASRYRNRNWFLKAKAERNRHMEITKKILNDWLEDPECQVLGIDVEDIMADIKQQLESEG